MLIDHLCQEFQKIPMLEFLSEDKQMAPFKGIQNNPEVPDLSPSSNSVLQLAECIPNSQNFKLHCDNWFILLKLIDLLAS